MQKTVQSWSFRAAYVASQDEDPELESWDYGINQVLP